jgi:clan AA aspartic protease
VIVGAVRLQEAIIPLVFLGDGRSVMIEAVVDTGFTGTLSLPPDLIASLGMRWASRGEGILADGSPCEFDVFRTRTEWHGRARPVFVNRLDGDPLIGMALLQGHELKMQVKARGRVTIRRLPKPRR